MNYVYGFCFDSEGMIDVSEKLIPTRVYRCHTLDAALGKSREEREAFLNYAGHDNLQVFNSTMGRFLAISGNTGESILIEIVKQ